jgi:hypothetical protein
MEKTGSLATVAIKIKINLVKYKPREKFLRFIVGILILLLSQMRTQFIFSDSTKIIDA